MNTTSVRDPKVYYPTTDEALERMRRSDEFHVHHYHHARRDESTVWRGEKQMSASDVEEWIRMEYEQLREYRGTLLGKDWVLWLAEEVHCDLRLKGDKLGFPGHAKHRDRDMKQRPEVRDQ